MFRKLLLALALLFSVAVPSVPAQTARQSHVAVQTKDCTVYVTRTGHRYHRAGCQYLKSSAIKMSRSEAIKGGYTPCKKCGGSECE
jgi:hypothetical protein